jgi:hypothetical protein
MPNLFRKIKECGCVVKAILCRIEITDSSHMYILGGHKRYVICDKCKRDEKTCNDTIYDMWMNDNITNRSGYAGWKEEK